MAWVVWGSQKSEILSEKWIRHGPHIDPTSAFVLENWIRHGSEVRSHKPMPMPTPMTVPMPILIPI